MGGNKPSATCNLGQVPGWIQAEDGYALPSVLMLVTILSLVAFSVLALQYLERKSALLDIARLKAEYASQNGIVSVTADLANGSLLDSTREYGLYDGSHASVRVIPWGALYLVESTGSSGKVKTHRRATLGERPSEAFSPALSIGNSSHQLVLTGEARVVGDVAVGSGGVSTGQLHGYSTPAVLPLWGKILQGGARVFPQADPERLETIGAYYRSLLGGKARSLRQRGSRVSQGQAESFPDSLQWVAISPGTAIVGSITRAENPLYVCSRGNITIGITARLSGLISIVSADSIVIESGASITGCVLVAMKGIRAEAANLSSVQLISPQIFLGPACQAAYPSIALSMPLDPRSAASQRLLLAKGVTFEGFLAMVSSRGDDVLEIEAGSRLTGAVYSSARLTLDGDLVGSALAHDLYFYEAPTSYLGWKRQGTIDRQKLPGGFLIAPIFKGKPEISVSEWK